MSIDAAILCALRSTGGGPMALAELTSRLGVSRATLRARIEELRSLGYEIDASPHEGYRLGRAPDVLHADDLMSRLGRTKVIGRDIRVFQETTSTNDIVEKLALDGVQEGVVVLAESQSKGRGRLGRKWLSPARKGIWLSVLLRPNLPTQEATKLTIAAATASVRAIRVVSGLSPEVKWPNDILLGGRKIAGILTELKAELDRVKYVVLGLGVDVNLNPSDFPPDLRKIAASVKIASGHPIDRAELAAALLRELDRDYARISAGEFEAVADEWESICTTLGRNVSVRVGDRVIQGCAESLDDDGALLLRTQHGHLERVMGGDVTLKG